MAFPAVQTADTKNGVQTTNSSSWTGTYPTNIAAGNLLLLVVSNDGGGVTATVTGFNDWNNNNSTANCVTVLARIADGTESGTFTINLASSEQGAWRIFRITGWYGSGLPASSSDLANGDGLAINPDTAGVSNTPNPPNLNPANWDVEDTLWIAACGVDTSRTISVYPLPDLNTADVSGGAGGATLGICMDDLAQASLDPGTFTISASDDWAAVTIAIRPAAPVVIRKRRIIVQNKQALERSHRW